MIFKVGSSVCDNPTPAAVIPPKSVVFQFFKLILLAGPAVVAVPNRRNIATFRACMRRSQKAIRRKHLNATARAVHGGVPLSFLLQRKPLQTPLGLQAQVKALAFRVSLSATIESIAFSRRFITLSAAFSNATLSVVPSRRRKTKFDDSAIASIICLIFCPVPHKSDNSRTRPALLPRRT